MATSVAPGYMRSAAFDFTRPADTTAYASGDHITTTTTAGSVVPMEFEVARENGGSGKIIGALLLTNSASAFGAMRLHLFNNAPFAAAGYQADNAALALTYAALQTGSGTTNPKNNYIGYVDFTTFTAHSSSALSIGTSELTEMNFACIGGAKKIYGLLEARAAITPASAQQFTAIVHARGVT
jgi:hypothetical protein